MNFMNDMNYSTNLLRHFTQKIYHLILEILQKKHVRLMTFLRVNGEYIIQKSVKGPSMCQEC